jgi:hypothetical protein
MDYQRPRRRLPPDLSRWHRSSQPRWRPLALVRRALLSRPAPRVIADPQNHSVCHFDKVAPTASKTRDVSMSAAVEKYWRAVSRRLPHLGALTLSACAFMAGGASAAAADTLSVSLSTSSPVTGVPFTITFGGTDTPFNSHGNTPELYALVRRENGVPCQPTFGQDQQVAGTDEASVIYYDENNHSTVSDGTFTYPISFTPVKGSYIVCAWLETDSEDHKGKGDVASEVVTANATSSYASVSPPMPKPACVVPRYRGTTLKSTEARLRNNHCGIGLVRYARNRHVKKGHVIRLSAAPHRRYAYGTKINITVSKG